MVSLPPTPPTPPTSPAATARAAATDVDQPAGVRRPSAWKLFGATALTAFGLVCVVSPGLFGRHEQFPSESSVRNLGVCFTVVAAMAASATIVGWRRRRPARGDRTPR